VEAPSRLRECAVDRRVYTSGGNVNRGEFREGLNPRHACRRGEGGSTLPGGGKKNLIKRPVGAEPLSHKLRS